MKTSLLIITAALSLPLVSVRAQDAPPDFRDKVQALEKRVKEANEAGRKDEAEKMMAEIRELNEQLQQRRKTDAMDKLRAEMEKAQGELAEAEKNGRKEESKGARQKIEEIKAVMEKLEKGEQAGNKPRGEGEKAHPDGDREKPRDGGKQPKREGDRPRGDGQGDQRKKHILQAAEHLQNAGMQDLAERLKREANGEPPRYDARREQPRPAPGGEVEEMRQAIRRLNARLEEMEKRQRGEGP